MNFGLPKIDKSFARFGLNRDEFLARVEEDGLVPHEAAIDLQQRLEKHPLPETEERRKLVEFLRLDRSLQENLDTISSQVQGT
jgi:hypothetical protein